FVTQDLDQQWYGVFCSGPDQTKADTSHPPFIRRSRILEQLDQRQDRCVGMPSEHSQIGSGLDTVPQVLVVESANPFAERFAVVRMLASNAVKFIDLFWLRGKCRPSRQANK